MKDEGIIAGCSTSRCWEKLGKSRCCDFQQGNYIVLYPGELEEAQAAGQSVAHLSITDADYHGGKKAVCIAQCTATCDNGFKPLDCKSYPYFPAPPVIDEVDFVMKGSKCPLQERHLAQHRYDVQMEWENLIEKKPEVGDWLNKVELVGYDKPETVMPALKIA